MAKARTVTAATPVGIVTDMLWKPMDLRNFGALCPAGHAQPVQE